MTVHWWDAAGMAGVACIVLAYLLIQAGRLDSLDLRYSVLNLIGALLITVSLIFEFNLSAFVIEMAWVTISIIGIARALKNRHKP